MLLSALYLWMTGSTPNTYSNDQPVTRVSGEPEAVSAPTDVTERVSQLIFTNSEEKPTIFTVSDPAAFVNTLPAGSEVSEGDKVLVWSDKTVVYSPSKDMLVAVYPTNSLNTQITTPPVPAESEAEATIEIRNGSGVPGAASRLKQVMTEQGLQVVRIGDARVRVSETLVVDGSEGKVPNALQEALTVSEGTLGALPEGEPASTASILVIIGQ